MFKSIIPVLLSGEFVCPVSHHEEHSYLMDNANQNAVNEFLGRIGFRLTKTRHGAAFFATHLEVGGKEERKDAKELFTHIKHTLRPIVSFMEMVMRAMQSDEILAAGAVIESNKLMAAIDTNPSFRNDLQSLATQLKGISADGTDRGRLEKVLRRFKDDGYLVLANAEREIYQVTGKIEFILEVIEFLMEHEGIADDEEPELPDQGSIF
jgi:hypothetical protein